MFTSQHLYCSISKVNETLPLISGLGLGVEVVLDNAELLWPEIRWEEILAVADVINEYKVETRVHGPFYSLNLGSRDSHVLHYSLGLLSAGLEVSNALGSPLMVFHTGYFPQLNPKSRVKWMGNFLPALQSLIERAQMLEVQLAMENTYEQDISLFDEIFERIQTPILGMCLDTGHAECFGKIKPTLWVTAFRDKICHIHCSDNDGIDDLHWGLGKGIVNFKTLLTPLKLYANEASITYEVSANDIADSKKHLEDILDISEIRSSL